MRYFAQILVEIHGDNDVEALENVERFVEDVAKLQSVEKPQVNYVTRQHKFSNKTIYDFENKGG